MSSRTRARSWNAKCGVAGPTRASISARVGSLTARKPTARVWRVPQRENRVLDMADSMPIDAWDHLELWVGNAKQAAYYYEHAFGFTPVAYAGPETGVRDRASYVLEQGEIRLVLTSGLRGDSEICRFAALHGDGVRDIALRVPDAAHAYR